MFWFEWSTSEDRLNSAVNARLICVTTEESPTGANNIQSEVFTIEVNNDECFSYVELLEDLEGVLIAPSTPEPAVLAL